MKLLVLAIDRDDDLGRKTGIQGPILGRDRVANAAQALAIADPEDSDSNTMFAAVGEYDNLLASTGDRKIDSLDVAALTGHVRVGTKSDQRITQQFEEVLLMTGADEVILVTDGAEDESILPILSSRVRIDGIRRVVIKQAKNLEGFVYLVSRMMNDEKLQKRFFIPLAFLLLAAAVSLFYRRPELFIGSALALAGFWIFIVSLSLQEPLGDAIKRLGKELREGKLSLIATITSLVLVVVGGWRTYQSIDGALPLLTYTLAFADRALWWVATAIVISLAGRGLDQWMRHGLVKQTHWKSIIYLLATFVFADAALLVAISWTESPDLLTVPWVPAGTYLFFAGFLAFCGLIASHYFEALHAAGTRGTAGK